MRAKEILGHKVMAVNQIRVGDGRGNMVTHLIYIDLDNGVRVSFDAVETEGDHVVEARLTKLREVHT